MLVPNQSLRGPLFPRHDQPVALEAEIRNIYRLLGARIGGSSGMAVVKAADQVEPPIPPEAQQVRFWFKELSLRQGYGNGTNPPNGGWGPTHQRIWTWPVQNGVLTTPYIVLDCHVWNWYTGALPLDFAYGEWCLRNNQAALLHCYRPETATFTKARFWHWPHEAGSGPATPVCLVPAFPVPPPSAPPIPAGLPNWITGGLVRREGYAFWPLYPVNGDQLEIAAAYQLNDPHGSGEICVKGCAFGLIMVNPDEIYADDWCDAT